MAHALLLLGLIALPICAGVLCLAVQRAAPRAARTLVVCAAGGAALASLLLLPLAGGEPTPGIEWLPGAGAISLGLGASGVYAAGLTTWAAFLALLAASLPPATGAAILFALGAGNAAFTAQHFLGRYAALEIAALCAALAPLAEQRKGETASQSAGVYLLLRLGDAGLLWAILILANAAGTFEIAPALEAGAALSEARLAWATAGLVLAAWIKGGGWPVHVWLHAGGRLGPAARGWLYATLLPNLGTYLLYRSAPLLVLAGPLRVGALWLGAGSALLSMWLALYTVHDLRGGLIYVGAAQTGVALILAAAGQKPAVWVVLLATTLPRLLLYLAADTAAKTEGAGRRVARRAVRALFLLGGIGCAALAALSALWVGAQGGASAAACAVALLMAAWTVSAARWLGDGGAGPEPMAVLAARWASLAGLGGIVLAGGVGWGALSAHLAAIGRFATPRVAAEALLWTALPGLMGAAALIGGVRLAQAQRPPRQPARAAVGVQAFLVRTGRALRREVEVRLQERVLVLVVRGVIDGARWMHRTLEERLLERLLQGTVRGVVWVGGATRRIVELGSLEGLLQGVVRAVRALSGLLSRLHTGKLRANMAWAAAALAAAVLLLVCWG